MEHNRLRRQLVQPLVDRSEFILEVFVRKLSLWPQDESQDPKWENGEYGEIGHCEEAAEDLAGSCPFQESYVDENADHDFEITFEEKPQDETVEEGDAEPGINFPD